MSQLAQSDQHALQSYSHLVEFSSDSTALKRKKFQDRLSKHVHKTLSAVVHCDYKALIKVKTDPQHQLSDLVGPTVASTEHQSAFHHAHKNMETSQNGTKTTDYHTDNHSDYHSDYHS